MHGKVLDRRLDNGQPKVDERFLAELRLVLLKVPTEFGWERPTWTRELLCLENVTRNHRCETMADLMEHVAAFPRADNRRTRLSPSLRTAIPVRESRSVV